MTTPPPKIIHVSTPPETGSPLRVAGQALGSWARAVTLDALIVGLLWWAGLALLHVPWAPLWAGLGALFQLIPGVGGMLAVVGPAIAAYLSGDDAIFRVSMVLGLYGVIAILEGLVIGPYILHRTTFVPWWAAVIGPILLGVLIPPWGVVLAPPLLAVVFAFVHRGKRFRRKLVYR